jgi:hypothetical protein
LPPAITCSRGATVPNGCTRLEEYGDPVAEVVTQGLVHEFYVTTDGHEHTRVFVSAGGVTGSLLDLSSGGPSATWIQALEPTRTIALQFTDFNALAAERGDVRHWRGDMPRPSPSERPSANTK